MYLRCRLPARTRELKQVGCSSLTLSAGQRHQQRRPSQIRLYSQQKQRKQTEKQKTGQSPPARSPTPASPNGQYDVAVIGGGITGLSAAYKLSRDPNAKVTLYESSSQLGGWLQQTERIKIDGGDVLFEYGPRTFRSQTILSYSTLHLLFDLGLKDQILYTSQNTPAAQQRYIYNQNRLLQLPNTTPPKPGTSRLKWALAIAADTLSKPVLRDFGWHLTMDFFGYKAQGRKRGGDESVASFVNRKLSPNVADNMVSAFIHGIYAGDIDKLSMKSVSYSLWQLDQLAPTLFKLPFALAKKKVVPLPLAEYEAVMLEFKDKVRQKSLGQTPVPRTLSIRDVAKPNSVFTLKGGMAQLVDRLGNVLQDAENVEVKTNAHIEKLSGPSKSKMNIELADGSSRTHDYVISTTSPRQLAKQIQGPPSGSTAGSTAVTRLLSSEDSDYAVTVMVVNLYYENPSVVPVRGFGYLIPRSVPLAKNPERALGVIFSSEVGIGQDTAQGTKLTVMLGGHWWDGWKEGDYPDEQTAIKMARKLLKRHLNITETPTITGARLQHNAIPQPTVGHSERMGELNEALIRGYGGRLKVGGAWYTGVGLNACIRTGTSLGLDLVNNREDALHTTGLKVYSMKDEMKPEGAPTVLRPYIGGRGLLEEMDAKEKRLIGILDTFFDKNKGT